MTPEQTELLTNWTRAVEQVAATKSLVENEMALRKQVMASFFPEPKEGTNNLELEAGWKLKAVYKLDRKVDEAALPAIMEKLRTFNVNPDLLIKRKVELDTTGYKTLLSISPETVKIFDECLTIKPASPSIELVPPKEKK